MHLLFDLDGTLTDSRAGIVRCIQHALVEVGTPEPPAAELTRCVGPPLAESFAALLGDPESGRIERAIAAYWRRFERVGMFENQLFPGIAEAIVQFVRAGHHLYVVTVKPRTRAVMIGDRAEDVLGAKQNGLRSIGVAWGYGDREELEAAQPDYLVTCVPDLLGCIRDAS